MSLHLVVNPVSIVDFYMVEFEDSIAMSSSIFELAFVAEPIRVEEHTISMSSPIFAVSLIFKLYFFISYSKLVVIF